MAVRADIRLIKEKRPKGGTVQNTTVLSAGFPVLAEPPDGMVAFGFENGRFLYAILDGPASDATDSDTGWETLERRKRKAALQYTGEPLKSWSLPLLLDGWKYGLSIENDCGTIERMREKVSAGEDPPLVRVRGLGPISRSQSWVVTAVAAEKTDEWMWSRGGNRMRAWYTVEITEAVFPKLAKIRPAKATRDARGGSKNRSVQAGSGDTAQRIALRELGDASRWRELKVTKGSGKKAKRVAVRDPLASLAGKKVWLP